MWEYSYDTLTNNEWRREYFIARQVDGWDLVNFSHSSTPNGLVFMVYWRRRLS